MRQTTSLHNVICSELMKEGFDELENNGEWTFFDSNVSFMKKIMTYDEDVQKIVNEKIFLGETLENKQADYHFKKTFIQKFANRTINRQTIESFAQQVVYTLLVKYDYINQIYDIDDFLTGKNTTETKGKDNKISDNRMLYSELPQSEVNLNVDDTVLDYGNENTITRNKDRGEKEDTSTNQTYDIETLVKVRDLLEQVFVEFDQNCFMQAF